MKKLIDNLYKSTKNYSLFVFYAKIICAALAIFILVSIIIIPIINPSNKQIDLTNKSSKINKKEEFANILNPQYLSKNFKNHSFELVADKISHNETLTLLFKPKLHLEKIQNKTIEIFSKIGEINSKINMLTLKDEVEIIFDNEYQLFTNHLNFNYKNKEFYSDSQTKIINNNSHLFSQKGFSGTIDKKTVTFLGPISGEFFDSTNNFKFSGSQLFIDYQKSNIYLENNVKISDGDSAINVDKISYNFNDNNKKILLSGNILMITKEGTIQANKGVYEIESSNLILQDNIKFKNKNNIALGDKFTYSIKNKKGNIESKNSRVKANINLDQK